MSNGDRALGVKKLCPGEGKIIKFKILAISYATGVNFILHNNKYVLNADYLCIIFATTLVLSNFFFKLCTDFFPSSWYFSKFPENFLTYPPLICPHPSPTQISEGVQPLRPILLADPEPKVVCN